MYVCLFVVLVINNNWNVCPSVELVERIELIVLCFMLRGFVHFVAVFKAFTV